LIDLDKQRAREITGVAPSHDLIVTELSTHLQGQLIAVHPAYNETFEAFVPGNKGQGEGTSDLGVRPNVTRSLR
jgi:hypothetical protein